MTATVVMPEPIPSGGAIPTSKPYSAMSIGCSPAVTSRCTPGWAARNRLQTGTTTAIIAACVA